MGINPNMAEVAALLGETSRATILASMMDGRLHTASELAIWPLLNLKQLASI